MENNSRLHKSMGAFAAWLQGKRSSLAHDEARQDAWECTEDESDEVYGDPEDDWDDDEDE